MATKPETTARTKAAWPLGLIGAFALIGLIEREIGRREGLQFTTAWAADWRNAGKLARREAVDSSILCFGDSLVKFGVSPQVLEYETGLRAYNLALNVGHPASSYFLLKRALDAGAKPRAIVVDFKSHVLAKAPQVHPRLWPELVSTSEWLDLSRETRDPEFAARMLASSLFSSVRSTFEIREAIIASLDGQWSPSAYLMPVARRNWRVNRGAQLMPKGTRIDDAPFSDDLYPASWSCDPVQERYVHRFLELAESTGADVFLVIPPPCPSVQARREAGVVDSLYEQFLRKTLASHPRVRLLDGRHAGYGPEVFSDALHLDRDGAVAYSQGLAEAVRQASNGRLDDSRWVALPRFRLRPFPGDAEDFQRSRRIVDNLQADGTRR